MTTQKPLAEIWEAVDLPTQRKLMRKTSRKMGREVLRMYQTAVQAADVGKGTRMPLTRSARLRTYPPRYGVGFLVTVKPHKDKGYHTNSRGFKKPVLQWLEDGTKNRQTKSNGRRRVWRVRKSHSTGRIGRPLKLLPKIEDRALPKVEAEYYNTLERNLTVEAAKRNLL